MNGPENISKYLRVPVPDQPALGILRLSPIKARELNLAPDQIIRGVVSEDGDFVEISTSNVQQQIRAQLEQWKGRVVELKVDLDQSGSRSSRASIKLEENSSVSKPIESPKNFGIHPKWLMTLLTNPNFERIKSFTTSQINQAVEWLQRLNPASAVLVTPFLGSIKKLDQSVIKKQLRSNGYNNGSEDQDKFSNTVTLQSVFSTILKNLEDISEASKVGLSAGQIKALVDYLDANAIEYILKKGQQEIGIRFLMLFSDFAPTEIFFKGQNVNPKKEGSYNWSVEAKSRVQKGDDFWAQIRLHKQRELTAEIIFTNPQSSEFAKQNLPHLKSLFSAAGLRLKECSIGVGKLADDERKELLKQSGNLDLSV